MSKVIQIVFVAIVILFCRGVKNPMNQNEYEADIIIYGGTSGAVVSAVEAIKSGKTALVVSPDIHLGGLSSGGLGFTHTGNKSTIGFRRFYC